jgi:hypothetical protein
LFAETGRMASLVVEARVSARTRRREGGARQSTLAPLWQAVLAPRAALGMPGVPMPMAR